MTKRAICSGFVLAILLGMLLGCDHSEPLAPVTAVESAVFRGHADPEAWAQLDEAEKARIWQRCEEEFARLRRGRESAALLALAREAHHLFPDERLAWVNLSTALLISGELGQTLTAARGALAEDRHEDFRPDTDHSQRAQAWCNIATVDIELELLDDALEALDQALAEREDFARAHLLRGEALHRLARNEEAVGSYRRAMALEPQVPDIVSSDLLHFSNALRDLGDLDGAEQVLREAIAQMPQDAGLHWHLGGIHQRRRHLEDALFELQHELLLRPESPYARRAAADLQVLMRYALERPADPASAPIARVVEALRFAQAGEGERAIAVWEEMLRARPEDDRSVYLPLMIARAHRALGRLPEALRWTERVLERDPNFVPALTDLAEIQETLGQSDEALQTLAEVQHLDPRSPALASHLAAFPEQARRLAELAAETTAAPASP